MVKIQKDEAIFDEWLVKSDIQIFKSDISSNRAIEYSGEKNIIQWQDDNIGDFLDLITKTKQAFIILSKDVFNLSDIFDEDNYPLMGEYLSDSDYFTFKQLYIKLNKFNGSLLSLDISFTHNGYIFQYLNISDYIETISEFNSLVELMGQIKHQYKYKVENERYQEICNKLTNDSKFLKGKNKAQREMIATDFIAEKFSKDDIPAYKIKELCDEAFNLFQLREIDKE